MYFDSLNKSECSGCTACMNICPTASIIMQEDEEGFLYPSINGDSCIHCDLCKKVCSWDHPSFTNGKEPLTLASVIKDKSQRQRSTSGGLFFAISEWIIQQGGVVYGAAFDNSFQLRHIAAETIEELQPIRGAKYIQSNIGRIFKDVEKNLKTGRWCYFTGTGCQVAGLKSYLRKDYPTLVTSDLVCHGVPSQKLFNEHISYMEQKYNDKVVSYHFRDYKLGRGCEVCRFTNRKPVIKPSYVLSPYLYSFMYAYTFRYSCYECCFAHVPRQGDITLADFWGVQKFFPEFDKSSGVSLLLINTLKGKDVWDAIKDRCNFEKSNVADAAKYNGNLVRPSIKPEIRNTIYSEINEKGYDKIANTLFKVPHIYRFKLIYFLMGFKTIQRLYGLVKKK